jgi:bifunctional non-homologous end joining protein LigD
VYESFSALCGSMAACLPVRDAVLDGEIVHLDAKGKPQFYSLLRRRSPQHFYAFDVLWLDGKDLRQLSLMKRKQILRLRSSYDARAGPVRRPS